MRYIELDQHVFRAFAIYKTATDDLETIEHLRKKTILRKRDWSMISTYKEWLENVSSSDSSKSYEVRYEIDRVLFALGKWAKKR